MKKTEIIIFFRLRPLITITAAIVLWLLSIQAHGQEPPPQPINVTLQQDLGFGAFYHYMAGGTVIINPDGSRQATGDIVLLNLGFAWSSALFSITGTSGTVVSLLNGPDVLLTGSNGGSLNFSIGDSDPPSPFVLTSGPLQLYVGGTITVGNPAANPPGNFSGTFDITFIQE